MAATVIWAEGTGQLVAAMKPARRGQKTRPMRCFNSLLTVGAAM